MGNRVEAGMRLHMESPHRLLPVRYSARTPFPQTIFMYYRRPYPSCSSKAPLFRPKGFNYSKWNVGTGSILIELIILTVISSFKEIVPLMEWLIGLRDCKGGARWQNFMLPKFRHNNISRGSVYTIPSQNNSFHCQSLGIRWVWLRVVRGPSI